MDYWDFLAHSQKGQERKGHKYYARVQTGTNKLGFPQYRYFYDAREYGAWKTRSENTRYSPKAAPKKGTTFYVIGKGSRLVDDNTVDKDIQRARGLGVYTSHILTDEHRRQVGAAATVSAKTVHDHKTLRKAKRNVRSATEKGKKKVASLLRKAADKLD